MHNRRILISLMLIALTTFTVWAQDVSLFDKVTWKNMNREAFEQAKTSKNMILLNVAPDSSHLTQWMDYCTYGEPTIADYINRRFVTIRVDPDARPDIDTRYQAASGALFGESGWPLTVAMLSTGEPVSAATVLKPRMSSDQPGMLPFLAPSVRAYRENASLSDATRTVILRNQKEMREKVLGILDRLRVYQNETTLGTPISDKQLDEFANSLTSRFDPNYAGFGKAQSPAPKMINGGAIRLALALGKLQKKQQLTSVGTRSLDAILSGAVYDPVMGGFHHYAVDREWRIPRFEKLLPINANALLALSDGYLLSQEARYKQAMESTVSFIQENLTNSESGGGFYASQAADIPGILDKQELTVTVTPRPRPRNVLSPPSGSGPKDVKVTILKIDNGGYHSWSLAELSAVLTNEERLLVASHYAIDASGELEDMPGKNVIAPVRSLEETAKSLNLDPIKAGELLNTALNKMKLARRTQVAPPVDKALYANFNGLMAAALFRVGRTLGQPPVENLARGAIDRLWRETHAPGKGVAHAINSPDPDLRLLTDQAGMAYGLITAFEHTGDMQYFQGAQELMNWVWDNFRDSKHGGLFDRLPYKEDVGLLNLPWKSVQDIRYPADNALAAWVYDRLYYFSKDKEQKKRAGEILEALADRAVKQGPDAAWFGLALVQHLHAPTFVVILGARDNAAVQALLKSAASQYDPNRIILVLGPQDEAARTLIGGYPRKGDAIAYVCIEDRCSRPIATPDELIQTIEQFTKPAAKSPLELDEL